MNCELCIGVPKLVTSFSHQSRHLLFTIVRKLQSSQKGVLVCLRTCIRRLNSRGTFWLDTTLDHQYPSHLLSFVLFFLSLFSTRGPHRISSRCLCIWLQCKSIDSPTNCLLDVNAVNLFYMFPYLLPNKVSSRSSDFQRNLSQVHGRITYFLSVVV